MTRAAGCDALESARGFLCNTRMWNRRNFHGEAGNPWEKRSRSTRVVTTTNGSLRPEMSDSVGLMRRDRVSTHVSSPLSRSTSPQFARFIRVQLSVNDAFSPDRSIRHCGNIPRDDRAKIQIYYSIWDDRYFQFLGRRAKWMEWSFFLFFLRSNNEIRIFRNCAGEDRRENIHWRKRSSDVHRVITFLISFFFLWIGMEEFLRVFRRVKLRLKLTMQNYYYFFFRLLLFSGDWRVKDI